MRRTTKLAVLIAAMLFMGAGCPIFRDRQAADTSREGVILTQGPPPADCGQRRANRLLPYFTIENPEIVLGEAIRIDGSCSVGEIVSLRWDFDFEAWPEGTPGEERFEPEIAVEGTAIDMNSTGPFYQVYTPLSAGAHTARLLATDARGTTHLVIHTYVVRPYETRAAAETELTPRFRLWSYFGREYFGAWPIPVGDQVVYLPHFQGEAEQTPFGRRSGAHYYAIADETTGPVLRYQWEMTSLERGGGLASSTPLLTYDRRIKLFLIHTGWALPRGVSEEFGNLGQVGERFPENNQTADFTVTLTVAGSGDTERSQTQRYRLIDPSTVRQPIAQLSLDTRTTLTPGYPMRINNASILSVAEVERTCRRGQCSARLRTPETMVEIDPGDGQYQEVGRMPAEDITFLRSTYDRFYNFGLKTRAPRSEGAYTARLRLTQINADGSTLQKEASLPYTVRGSVANYNLTIQPQSARAGENVTFTARPSVPVPPLAHGYSRLFHWQLSSEGRTVADNYKGESIDIGGERLGEGVPYIYQYRFNTPGVYELRLTVAEGPISQNPSQLFQTGDHRVSEARAQITISGAAPPLTKATGSIPNVDVVPVGVAIVPGLSNPIYENDDILYRVRDLSRDSTLVQWDYTNDGIFDTYCQVQIFEGFPICGDEKRPAPQTPGNYTARVRVASREGSARERTVNYAVTVGERGGSAQSTRNAEPARSAAEYIQIFVGGRSSPLTQGTFPAATALGFYAVVNADDSAITSVRWDFDGDGRWDSECETPTPDGRQLICNTQQTLSDLSPGTHRATVFIERNNGPDISLQRVFDIGVE